MQQQQQGEIKARLRAYSDKTKGSHFSSDVTSPPLAGPLSTPKKKRVKKEQEKTPDMTGTENDKSSKQPRSKKMDVETLGEMLTSLTSEVKELKNSIEGGTDSKSKISEFEVTLNEEKKKIADFLAQGNSDSFKLKLLMAIVIRQEQKIDELSAEVKILRREGKQKNIFISGLLEGEAEETSYQRITLVEHFIKEQMEIEKTIGTLTSSELLDCSESLLLLGVPL